jgi:hypothetical protein
VNAARLSLANPLEARLDVKAHILMEGLRHGISRSQRFKISKANPPTRSQHPGIQLGSTLGLEEAR